MRGLPNLQRTVGGVAAKIFFAHSHGGSRISRGGDVSGRISIPICIAAAVALLVSGIGTDLQATTRANDCLTAPNASSPRGQHWYYHMDLPNNRKCWYLHAPLMHRAAKASESHAVFTAADTPVSGSRADSAPRLPHSRILSVKPQPTSFVSAKSIQRGAPTWVQQENVPQGNALQVDGSKLTDAAATSAAAKPIEQSDASSIPQQNVPQESTLQVDGSKLTDAAATSSPAAAKPIEQSGAPWAPQESVPQESTLQVDGSKPTDAAATSSPAAAKPIEQSGAPWAPQENVPQESTLQVDGSKLTDAAATSSPAAAKPIEQSGAPWAPQESVPQESTLQVDGSKLTDAAATSSPQPQNLSSRVTRLGSPQENVPQESTLQVDGSKPTDAAATSSAAKPIEQSDASSIPQQNVPQESTLQVDGSKLTDAAATSSPAAAKPIEQSGAPWAPQESVPQESTLQVDGSKPTDAAATSSAVKPIEQSDAPSIPQQNVPQESTLQVGGSKSTDAVVASSPAITTFRVAGADSAPPDADSEAFHDGGRIAERSNPTIKADIVRGLSFKPVQIFLLLVFGVAIVVISLMIIIHRRVTAVIDFQLDHERSEAQAKHGLQDDRADARSPQMFVDNRRGQDGIDSPPWWKQPSVKRPQDRDATSMEPPRPSLEDVKAAPEHFKAALIYENRTENRDYTFMYAPSWARRKPPMVAAHETSIERPPQDHVVDAARPFSGDLAVEDLRRRRSLTPEIVPEPKFLKGDHTRTLIALRLSGVTAIAALIAWVVVSLPAMHRQPGNDNVHTAVLANPTDGEQDQLPTPTARSPLNDQRLQANEPRANGGLEERQSEIATVMAGPVADAIMPATASPSTGSRLERTTVQPDEEEISALIKLAQGFLSNRDISSARLLLRRAAEAGSAAAALSLGETFDPLVIRQLHAIGVQPDPAKAREWYERAAQLGSDAASQHLAKLAQSPQ